MLAARPLRILVVDDDPAMVGAITALVGTEGHQVITAYDGLTAVKRFREESPDLVLLDLAMPGPDGFTVAGQIRAAGGAPILVVSGESAEEAKVRALGLGADDYLTKPFAFRELLARVRALARRRPTPLPEVIRVGDLEVDLGAHRVQRGGHEIELTAKEFALLEFFVRNAGRVVDRAAITAHVWDDNHDPFTNVLEVLVRRLRRKIDDGFDVKLIHTLRGAGYRLGI
jgi:two-component system copper resistance phosphate regulon response regulator CusR